MSKNLFENESESDTEISTLKTNKDYANSYNKFRSKELLKKLKDKDQGVLDSENDTESSDDESEIIENQQFDRAFFKTLASIKTKDPSVYDKNIKFFDDIDVFEKRPSVQRKSQIEKPITIKDYERNILLEKGGIYEKHNEETDLKRPESPTYVEQQKNLKNQIKKLAFESDSDDDGGSVGDDTKKWGGIFKKRSKTAEEKVSEEADYGKWLSGQQTTNIDNLKTMQSLKDYWANPKLTKDEVFLRDYIFNNGYYNKNANEIPTYDEIVVGLENDAINLSDDEAELEKQAEFEQKFNFRFEETDQEFIKRYPRTIENSVRKMDNRRKEKRREVKDRKAKEKEEKMKELEMLNAIRRKEIEEKIEKLKSVSGIDGLTFDSNDFDEDFNPDEYDRKMQQIFNNEYYNIDEGEEKPECPNDIDELKVENWDNYDPEKDVSDEGNRGDELYCEDEDFNMDCEYKGTNSASKLSIQNELIESTWDKRKRRKRRSKFVEMLKQVKPVFDAANNKTYAEYLDEYYKLDYEDVIDNVPCRFKYVETVPNDFGLTVNEILMAKNKELNQWASLKKATHIRPEHIEKNEVKLYQQKAKNYMLKKKILASIYGEEFDKANEDATHNKNVPEKLRIKNYNLQSINETKSMEVTKEINQEKLEQVERKESNIKSILPQRKINKKKVEKLNFQALISVGQNVKNSNSPDERKIIKSKFKSTNKLMESNKSKLSNKKSTKNLKLWKINQPSRQFPMLSDERLRAFGMNPKKYHKKLKYAINAMDDISKKKNKLMPYMSNAKQDKQQIQHSRKEKIKLKKLLNKSSA